MVKAGRTIGRLLRRTILSPTWLNVQRKVRNLPYELMREAGLEDQELRAGINDIRKMTKVDLAQELNRSFQPQSTTNPPPGTTEPPQIPTPAEPLQAGNGNQANLYPDQVEPPGEPPAPEIASDESATGEPDSDPTQT